MPGEVQPQEQATVAAAAVTDADLSSAWNQAQATETATEETQPTEQVQEETQAVEQTATEAEIPEEPADNAERSKLGRRLKGVEETINKIASFIEQQAQERQLQQFATPPVQQPTPQEEIPEYITTPAELEKYLAYRDGQKQRAETAYQGNYLKNCQAMSRLDPDLSQDIFNEMVANFNTKHTGNAVVDSQLNWAQAKSSVLAKKLAAKANPEPSERFQGTKTALPTGVSATTRTQPPKQTLPKLDEAALEFIKSTGMSDESVRAALSGEMPINLRGRR